MYELLTRHPRRDPGALIYLSDVTDELDEHGLTWNAIGVRWLGVIEASSTSSVTASSRPRHQVSRQRSELYQLGS